MRAELRLAWVRDLPVLLVEAGEGSLLTPMGGPWWGLLPRYRDGESPGAPDGPRVASEPDKPA